MRCQVSISDYMLYIKHWLSSRLWFNLHQPHQGMEAHIRYKNQTKIQSISVFRPFWLSCDGHKAKFCCYHNHVLKLDSRGRYDTFSRAENCLKIETLAAIALLSEAITEAGFGKQGADWQANDVSWMSHYAPSPLHTHSAAPSPRERLISPCDARGRCETVLCGERFSILVCDYSNELAPQPW